MSNQRLEMLMKKSEVQYAMGSPLLLEASALYLDTTTNNCIAQLKWKNLDSRPVNAVIIKLVGFDAFGQKLEPIHYQYDRLHVTQGLDFGGKTPILINNKVVKYDVVVQAVSFSDDTKWRADSETIYMDLPKPKKQELTGPLFEQYERDLTKQGIKAATAYSPQSVKGLWQCGCGSWQLQGSPCLKCRTTQRLLNSASQPSILEKHLKEYEAEQERLRIEAERKAEQERINAEKRAEQERIEAEKRARQERIEAEKKRKRNRIVAAVVATILVVTGVALIINNKVIQPRKRYNAAQALLEKGKYDEAAKAFSEMNGYSDSAQKIKEAYYSKATVLLNVGELELAKECFLLAGDYSDAAVMAQRSEADRLFSEGSFNAAYLIYKEVPADYQIHEKEYRKMYNDAKKMANDGKYDAAMKAFLKIASYRDAETQAYESQYSKGLSLRDAGEYDAATWAFADLVDTVKGNDRAVEEKAEPVGETDEETVTSFEERFANVDTLNLYLDEQEGYRDSLEQARESRYLKGTSLMSAAQYDDASEAFISISSYKDAADQARQSQYEKAKSQLEKRDYEAASRTFKSLGEYSDASSQVENIAQYLTAETRYSKGEYLAARPYYAELGDYLDSVEKLDTINQTLYAQAAQKMEAGDIAGAYEAYSAISDYSDSAEIMAKVDSDYQNALDLWNRGDKTGAETALMALPGWRDADAKLEILREEIADDAVAAEDYDTALAYYAKLKNQTEAVTTKITAATQAKNYQEAVSALDSSNLKTAYAKFVAAGDYSDAAVRAAQLDKYIKANEAMTTGAYSDARAAYVELGDFLDSEKNLETCNEALYDSATTQMESGDIAGAYETFRLISGYKDSAEITAKVDSDYQAALDLWEKGDKTGAESALVTLVGWNDVDAKLETLREEIADDAAEAGDYDTALAYYAKLANRTEALETKVTATTQAQAYQDAAAALASGDLKTAYTQFVAAGEHEDAAEQAAKLEKYTTANADMESGQYMKARTTYKTLGDYLESAKNLETCNAALYKEAAALMENGDVAGAYVAYSHISDYSDSSTIAEGIKADYDAAAKLQEEGKYDEANAAFMALKNYSDSETQANESVYRKAVRLAEEGQCAEAAALFDELGEYSDSNDKANEAHYNNANTLWQSGNLQGAVAEYEALGDYSDAPQLLVRVNTEIANKALEEKDYATALTAYQHLEQTDEIKAKEYELAQACYEEGHYAEATSAYETLGQYELSLSKLPIARYAWADQLFNEGSYAEAAEQFSILGEMTDSAERAKESTYQLANQQLEAKDYDTAKATFQTIKGYSDADTMAQECDYRKASDMLADSEYMNAQTLFEALGTYSDSATRAKQCVYEQAEALYAEADYAGAEKLYASVDYEDSADKAKQCVYNRAELLFEAGDYAGAAEVYGSVEYEDSEEKAKLSTYNQAEALFEAEDYAEAKTVYASVDYEDSKDKAKLSEYREAEVCYAEGSYADAEKLFAKLGDYSDSADRAKDSHVQQGNVLMQAGDYAGAIKLYESVDYGDSAILAAKCHYEIGNAAITSGDMDSAVSEYAQATVLQDAQDAMIAVAKDYMAINETKKAVQVLWVLRESEAVQYLLKEIGDLKRQSGDTDEALLVYCTLGEGALLENSDTLSVTGYGILDTCLDACKLLPDDLHFSDAQRYTFASAALSTNQYDLATTVFNTIADFDDAATQALESQYKKGTALLAEKEYDKATETFNAIEAYKDASTQALESQYEKGMEQLDSGKFDAATTTFSSIGEYSDSGTQALESQYRKGITQIADHDYDAAIATFESISGYKDANEQLIEGRYQKASSLFQSGDYYGANEVYTALGKYKDAESLAVESLYQYGCSLVDKNKYEDAIEILKPLNGYKDVYERVISNESLRYTLISSLFKVGDTVTFGHFGESDLDWYIIKASGKSRYLITTRNVDSRQFNSRNSYRDKDRGKYYHWGTSDLRSWLNGTFFGKAFDSSQKKKIVSISAKYHKYSYEDKVSAIFWIPNFSRYDLPADLRDKLEADYWTGGVSDKEDTYKVSDNNSGSDYSFIYAAYTMTNYGCPMTEKHGVRPVIQIDLAAYTDKDLGKLWPSREFGQLQNEDSTEHNDNEIYETLNLGSKGIAVQRLQQALIDQGFLSGKADGDYGNKTVEAVKKAQKVFGMEQTGIADRVFQKMLFDQ